MWLLLSTIRTRKLDVIHSWGQSRRCGGGYSKLKRSVAEMARAALCFAVSSGPGVSREHMKLELAPFFIVGDGL